MGAGEFMKVAHTVLPIRAHIEVNYDQATFGKVDRGDAIGPP
jgi:hypothetical protein